MNKLSTIEIQKRLFQVFSPLTFEEERHLYFWKNIRVPKSVSALVEDHADPFDEQYWLPICARKENTTEHELRHKWQTINQLACDLGTDTHDFLQKYNGLQKPRTAQETAGINFLRDISIEYEVVGREIRAYSEEFDYAGTLDLLLRHRREGYLAIGDYKTNADLFKTFGVLRYPFNYLENHPYSKYQLQISYYQIMLESIGLEIEKRLLVYLKADALYQIYECYSFTEQITKHLRNSSPIKRTKHASW